MIFEDKMFCRVVRRYGKNVLVDTVIKNSKIPCGNVNSNYHKRSVDLIYAIRNKDYLLANRLVKNDKIPINSHDKSENTPLTDCAERGDLDGVIQLCEMGADLNASCDCPQSFTAMHYACKNGHTDIVKYLLSRGANMYKKDANGCIPMYYTNKDEIKQLFIESNNKKVIGTVKKLYLTDKN